LQQFLPTARRPTSPAVRVRRPRYVLDAAASLSCAGPAEARWLPGLFHEVLDRRRPDVAVLPVVGTDDRDHLLRIELTLHDLGEMCLDVVLSGDVDRIVVPPIGRIGDAIVEVRVVWAGLDRLDGGPPLRPDPGSTSHGSGSSHRQPSGQPGERSLTYSCEVVRPESYPVCSRTRQRRASRRINQRRSVPPAGELYGKWKCAASRCPERCDEVVDGLRQRCWLFFGGPVSAVAEHRGTHVNGAGLAQTIGDGVEDRGMA
jgi:hypothetical protein